ncbi:hypothetical protein BDR06DRAFT_955617, partial [Suillus hirtellus]
MPIATSSPTQRSSAGNSINAHCNFSSVPSATMRLLFTTAISLSQAFVVLSQHAEAAFRAPLTCEERARQAGYPPNPGYAPYPYNPLNPAYPLNPPNFPAPWPGPCPQPCGNGHGGVEPSCRCTNYPVCGHGKYLGIKYGHCYILSFADGEQLGIDRDHTDYKKNGFFVDIPFKVCNSTTDCSRGKEVEMGQSFSLQDQHG